MYSLRNFYVLYGVPPFTDLHFPVTTLVRQEHLSLQSRRRCSSTEDWSLVLLYSLTRYEPPSSKVRPLVVHVSTTSPRTVPKVRLVHPVTPFVKPASTLTLVNETKSVRPSKMSRGPDDRICLRPDYKWFRNCKKVLFDPLKLKAHFRELQK